MTRSFPARGARGRQARQWRSVVTWSVLGLGLALFVLAEFAFRAVGCGIKGNIGEQTGERIYHVPGQEYYSATRINWLRGERWFCSEAAARRAGWRRAKASVQFIDENGRRSWRPA